MKRTLVLVAPLLLAANSAPPEPLEHDQTFVRTSEGLRLSAWISRQPGTERPLPALFLTQWVSCGSVAPGRGDPGRIEALARAAGYAVIRVDRSGTGQSEGPGCDRLDYETEVRHYREALDQLAKHAWIDPGRVVIFGSSLGSTTAPLVAEGRKVAGVLVQGGGALTHFERMVRFDRNQLERGGTFDPQAIDAQMRRRIAFHQLYLHQRQTPEQIEAAHPELRGVWAAMRGTVEEPPHYGRPYAWHWQAASQNWLAAWARIEAPVMVVYGEYDQFESREGHRLIVDTVERLRPGTATWLELSQADHGLETFADPLAAYADRGGKREPERFVEPVARWLRALAPDKP